MPLPVLVWLMATAAVVVPSAVVVSLALLPPVLLRLLKA
jgi:hypothetical protein